MAPSLWSGWTKAAVLALLYQHATAACAPRFNYETAELTEAAIADIAKQDSASGALLDFGADPESESASKKPKPPRCKVFPGDAAWPSDKAWNAFNASLGGALIKTIPLAAPCYNNWPQVRNAAQCQHITDNWSNPRLHLEDPTSAMFPIFQGRTCLPTDDPTQNCTLGGYASYSVAITTVSQIQLALNFARNANIRLVVRNTGHDFADKSIGAGALSIWTHKLKGLEYYSDYRCKKYKGPAFKLGAGVVTEEVYAAAEKNGVTAVGGECRTVGLAGGYVAGGGHSPVSVLYGMGADQVISLDVVLPNGRFVTVSEDSNPDLYWALRGGGGGTFGVVTSVVIKAYPKTPVTTMSFVYTTTPNVTADTFWASVGKYFSYFDQFTNAGAFGYFLVVSIGPGEFLFSFMPFWGNNMTAPQLTTLVTPYLNDLASLGIAVTPNITEYPTMYSAFNGSWGPEQVGAPVGHAASRLFPKENFQNPAKRNATVDAVRYAIESGGVLVGYNIKAAANSAVNQDNAVHAAWRTSTGFFILGAGQLPPNATDAQIAANAQVMTTDWMQRWRDVSPGSGTYLSESDINEPNFQQAFWGSHYPKLYKLKQKYDPTGLLYAHQAVGSEDWYITGQIPYYPTQNGKLCRK
ncbi:FAD-binding domain-containing protein [Podospora aff. communis PSN243]|uniref:FAD-binding domain-containing protein n=1 Tax=Podospora aff. communis PSN243 TaxID=3040156 RepID=A0AAV9GUE9_9PEZI|nr:FAD-binding domain-containing protein [Podospora aff. communis PSN243]